MDGVVGAVGALAAALAALAFVLALAWLAIRGLKRMQDRGLAAPGEHGPIRFLRALPLGPRERAVLVECAGERLLLGVAAGSVTLLARWVDPPAGPASAAGDRS